MKKTLTLTAAVALSLVGLTACAPADPPVRYLKPTATPTVTVTATPTADPSPAPTKTVTTTATPKAAPTQTVTQTPQGPDGTILDRARYYMESGNMSKQALINALVAEGWSFETAEETELAIRGDYNYDEECISAAKEYLQYTPDAGREELINYLHLTLLFSKEGSTRIVDEELGLKWY